ncbi:DUF1572 family protein [Paenibacillus athensensis]|uniref:DUF1572 domain-containing protein n=1 Tax=Paenibacillus athensensis TaxID=1967502 RepID=A0A4Y8Q7N0_9BACL|nr:DinB family protein [Paenibacillus athensensis]MCD1257296.1 DUF1572 family protein [Paenibacillus athensensis]
MVDLINDVLGAMDTQLRRIEVCLERLTEEQVWERLREGMNSVGNLCVHLAGNEHQHFISGIGGKRMIRERTREFTMSGSYTRDGLVALLRSVREEARSYLTLLTAADLGRDVTIFYGVEDWFTMKDRGVSEQEPCYTRKLGTILLQVAEHYAYHAGQIVLITKQLQATTENVTEFRH